MPPQTAAVKKVPPYRNPPAALPPCPPERYAEVGMVIQHYPDARIGAQPTCAIVTKVGLETIDCSIVHPAIGTLMPFSGVHHLDFQANRVDSEGAWRPLAFNVAILRHMISIGALVWDGEAGVYRVAESDSAPQAIETDAKKTLEAVK